MIVLQIASPEEVMLAGAVELIVEPRDVGVVAERRRTIEAVTRRVEVIADGIVVRVWIRLKECQDIRVGPLTERIDLSSDVGWRQRRLPGIEAIAVGILRSAGVVSENSLAELIVWHHAYGG